MKDDTYNLIICVLILIWGLIELVYIISSLQTYYGGSLLRMLSSLIALIGFTLITIMVVYFTCKIKYKIISKEEIKKGDN